MKSLNTKRTGFVILYAVIVTSIALIVGLSLLNIIAKQMNLSYVSRSSKQAAAAAYTGERCMSYWYQTMSNRRDNPFSGPDKSTFSIYCTNDPITPVTVTLDVPGGSSHSARFLLNLNYDSTTRTYKSCADVSAALNQGSNTATSRGYNVGCDMLDSIISNPRAVQKVVQRPIL